MKTIMKANKVVVVNQNQSEIGFTFYGPSHGPNHPGEELRVSLSKNQYAILMEQLRYMGKFLP